MPPKLSGVLIDGALAVLRGKMNAQGSPAPEASEGAPTQVYPVEPREKVLPKKRARPAKAKAKPHAEPLVEEGRPIYEREELENMMRDWNLSREEALVVMEELHKPMDSSGQDPTPKAPSEPATDAVVEEPVKGSEPKKLPRKRPRQESAQASPIDLDASSEVSQAKDGGLKRSGTQSSVTTLILGQSAVEKQITARALAPQPKAPSPARPAPTLPDPTDMHDSQFTELGPSASEIGTTPMVSEEELRRRKRLEAAMAREREACLEREQLLKEQEDAEREQLLKEQEAEHKRARLEAALNAPPSQKKAIASPAPEAPAGVDDENLDGEECEEEELVIDPPVDPGPSVEPARSAPRPPALVPAPLPPSRPEDNPGAVEKPEKVNSSTHKKEWMHLDRLVASQGHTLPGMAEMWNKSTKDRNIVLRKFLESGRNAEACEASVQLSRDEIDKVKKGMVQMTLQDMIDAKFSQQKIESIIRRGHAECDPDAPDDAESVLFWCNKKGEVTNVAQVTKTQKLKVQGRPSEAFANEMASQSVTPAAVLALGLGDASASKVTADALLKASRELASGSSGASAGASKGSGGGSRAKALPKKKGTAKVIPQQKMTPNEMKTETRNQLKRELNANNMVLLDLPTGHDLRKNLETTQSQYQQILEKLLSTSDPGEISDFHAQASTLVDAARLIKAQARAVASELRKTES